MNVEKLPSGSYRVRQQYEGKRYTVTFDHKPNSMEIAKAFEAKLHLESKESFSEAAQTYIDAKSKTLSPSTIKAYQSYFKNMPEDFKKLKLSMIDSLSVQKLINSLSEDHSSKYVRNISGFISAVMSMFAPQVIINVSLPKKVRTKDVRPSSEDIKRILDASKGTMFEVALWLAVYGLRRSEMICLTEEDLNGNILSINKAKVQASDLSWIIKETKTAASCREIYLDDYVVDLIHKNGFYKGHPNSIVVWLYKTEDKLGIDRFPLHYFRHYFAARMSTVTDEATVLKLGGWKTDYVMKSTYRYALDENIEAAQKASQALIDGIR